MASRLTFLLLVSICFMALSCINASYYCQNYHALSNGTRSINYTDGTYSMCDDELASGWYRFMGSAGSRLLDYNPGLQPNTFGCKTHAAGWLNGQHPSVADGEVSRTVCFIWWKRNNIGDPILNCRWSTRIKIRNCGSYFIYYLVPTPVCWLRYCGAGGNGKFPKILSRPTLVPGKANTKSILTCKFKSNGNVQDSVFEITWYEGPSMKKINHVSVLLNDEREAHLEEKHLSLFTLGKMIACRVRSWNRQTKSITSPYHESNHYYAGILITPTIQPLSVTERGSPLIFNVKVTIPISCEDPFSCLQVRFSSSNSEALLNTCVIDFLQSEANHTKTLEVYGKRDFINDGDQVMRLWPSLVTSTNPLHWRRHSRLPNFEVTVTDGPTATCRTTNDPRIITLDGKYYSHLQPGDYVFLKSTARKFEVHVRTKACSRGTCNCGFAAREDNDVIVVDGCKDGIPRPRFASKSEPALGTSLRRDHNGRGFDLKFPSGATIQTGYFQSSAFDFSNIWVTVPNDDFNKTKGLCGTFDRNSGNEMQSKDGIYHDHRFWWGTAPLEFTESWKLEVGKSFFYYKDKGHGCSKKKARKYCNCVINRSTNCKSGTNAEHNEFQRSQMTTLAAPISTECNKRKRRSIQKTVVLPEEDDSAFYIYNPTPLIQVNITWPTPKNKTLSDVRKYCNNLLKNSAPGKLCAKLPDFSFETYAQQCIDDVQTADDYTFAPASLQVMQDACGEVLVKNISYWEPDPTGNGTKRPSREMAQTMCPGLCSGHGTCINATCHCDTNYTSADCSLDRRTWPSIRSIAENGLCDIRKRKDCHLVTVTGRNFMNVKTLSCRSTKLLISFKPYKETSIRISNQANLLSYGESICDLKNHRVISSGDPRKSKSRPHDGYLIEVSNDGKIYSKEKMPYVIYDSKCMDCNGLNAICSLKPDTCNINGYCFTKGENYSADPCFICKPSVSRFQLTPNCVAKSKSQLVLIVCSIAAGVLLILFTTFVICCIRHKKVQGKVKVSASPQSAKRNEGLELQEA